MHGFDLIIDLVLAVVAALIGGAIAQRFRQPAILGYLVAGAVIGATNIFHARDLEEVPVLAEIGVALLMFILGIEFNLRRLRAVRDVAIFGGLAQILLTLALGAVIGTLFGFNVPASIFFGGLIALSSTVVVLRILDDRGELGSLHGQIAVGILIIQDLSVVPMMIILPELSRPAGELLGVLGIAILKAAAVLITTYFVGTRLVPRILFWVVASGSRELFLLAIFSLALGTALLTQLFGLSLAFGAFLAGLVVSESDFSYEAIGEVEPIRDLFATLFFVSIGQFINLQFVLANWVVVAVTVLVIVAGKFLIAATITWLFRYPLHTALAAGLALSQIGEFSFVLAQVGFFGGAIDEYMYSLTLSAAVLTMLLSPFLIPQAGRIVALIRQTPGGDFLLRERSIRSIGPAVEDAIGSHVVIAGFGRVGQELAAALERRGFRYLIIEQNPRLANRLRESGVPCLIGNCANRAVLHQADLERARLLAIAVPDGVSAMQAAKVARQMNPRLDIIARSHSLEEMERLVAAGVTEAVLPEFEAGLEFIRHTLRRYGISGQEIQSIISARRATYYRR